MNQIIVSGSGQHSRVEPDESIAVAAPNTAPARKYGGMDFRICSVLNMLFGLLCVTIHFNILMQPVVRKNDQYVGYDKIGAGIWSGIFYFITGVFAFASYLRYTKKELQMTLVFSVVSAASGIVTTVLCGLNCGNSDKVNNDIFCSTTSCGGWYALQLSLLVLSLIAVVNNITLSAVSVIPLRKRTFSIQPLSKKEDKPSHHQAVTDKRLAAAEPYVIVAPTAPSLPSV